MLHIIRKGKLKKRVIAGFMALLMVASLLPTGLLGEAFVAKAASTVYKFDATELTAEADKEAIEAGTTYAEGYFKVFGTVTKRTNSDGSMKAVEVAKAAGGGIEFTVTGTASVKVGFSSTGGNNTSAIGIFDAEGNLVANKENLTTVTGSSETTVTYELEAGTYQVVSPKDSNNDRGARVFSVEVEEVMPTSTITQYVFDSTELTAEADKEAITAGTTYADGYFKVFGTVTKRTNSDGSMKAVEVAKAAGGGIEFTVTGIATVKVGFSSTGGNNTSAIGIFDAEGNLVANKENLTTVTGSSETTVTYELEAGTYQVVSPKDSNNDRGARVFSVEVEEVVPTTKTTEYLFDSTELTAEADKEAIAAGTTYADGYFKVFGTVTKRTNSDGSMKAVEVAKAAGGGIEFTVTGTATVEVGFSSTGGNNTSAIGIFDAEGNLVANKENLTTVTGSSETTVTYELEAGTYQVVSPKDSNNDRGARVFSVKVTETTGGERPARQAWDKVAAPVITAVTDKDGSITVAFDMVIGYDGADSVKVQMLNGTDVVAEKSFADTSTKGEVVFTPSSSGEYTFKVIASRAEETNKESAVSDVLNFSLPLKAPAISSATSMGSGKVSVVWGAVPEAEKYELYCDGELVTTTEELSYVVTGLTVGTKYAFTVVAVRGEDKSDASVAKETTATADAKQVWGTTIYGPSTDTAHNGVIGDLNEDGKVTVYSEGGKGKVVPNSTDGLTFYYTAVPADMNFTLRAKVTVDSWTLSNGQDGFGLLATDQLGANGAGTVWNNQYMALASKVEYTVDGTKYSMKLGLGVIEKIGVTKDNLAKLEANDTATVQNEFKTSTVTLDNTPEKLGKGAGTYNIIGNATKDVEGTVAELTEFVLEIQKNNTGYFVTYYDAEGNVINRVKYYDTEALSMIDEENVYVGFFAARNARATFSDVEFTTIAPEKDAPAEEKPITKIEPTVTIQSADIANTENYTLALIANVDGTATVKLGDKVIAADLVLEGGVKLEKEITLPSTSKNELVVEFTPDPDQEMEEDTVLANTNKVTVSKTVNRCTRFEKLNNIYVSPDGLSTAKGTKSNPVDIYTAVKYVQPGQTIIIMEGTYLLSSTVRVERGINGTADAPIRMVADPNAKTRPVFDFQSKCAGMVLGGDYWYFNGFDVTKSANAQKGIQVSGDNNVLDNINAYYNGNTGIQISRLFSADLFADWPANNLILNCTSYGNADAGYEDADGFAAKLTVGEGNVFDGCVAFNNADDGWDLYAKVETGAIGAVTIQNCVAFLNGYLEDGTNAGNGNGFKMGGESITGKHVLKNSYAFFNKAKGIDSNSCPDIRVYNSISYNNESYNVALYTNNAADTDFIAEGIISFKDASIKSGKEIGESFKPKGTQDESKYTGDSNYYWNGSKSVNASGAEATADWFKSLTFTGITRNADGTINMNGFLELTDKAPEKVGAVPGGQASKKVEVVADAKEEVVKEVEVTDKTTVDELLNAVEAVINEANKKADGSVPVLSLAVKENTEVSAELLVGVKGEEVVVRLELENGIIWDIYGKDVTDNAVKVDLGVVVNSDAIPEKDLAKVKELGAITSLSIAHDGEFGFDATIKYAFGKEVDGKYATLFWYNDGAFEKAGSFVVEGGYAEFVLTHASDYVIVLSDAEITTDTIEPEEEPIAPKGDMAFSFYMILFLGIGLVAVGFYAKKKYAA